MKKKKQFVLYSYKDYMKLFFFSPLTSDRVKELNLRPVYLTDNPEDKRLYYKYHFPIMFWDRKDGSKTPTLFCEILIDSGGEHKVKVDCIKTSGETYAYFYCTEVNIINRIMHPMLIHMHETIRAELKRMGIAHSRKELRPQTEETQKESKKLLKKEKKEKKKNDNKRRIQKTRKSKMGNPIPNKQIQRRNTGNRYTSKRRKFSGKMLQN